MKLDPQIFVEAAERIHDERNFYSCVALIEALLTHGTSYASVYDSYSPYHIFYAELFEIKGNETFGDRASELPQSQIQEIRILALLFAAEVLTTN